MVYLIKEWIQIFISFYNIKWFGAVLRKNQSFMATQIFFILPFLLSSYFTIWQTLISKKKPNTIYLLLGGSVAMVTESKEVKMAFQW